MKPLLTLTALVAVILAVASLPSRAQSNTDPTAITARLHGTFLDAANGLGVLSGDMTVTGFEVRFGTLTALGQIEGALADAKGEVLGRVEQDVALSASNITASCNRLRLELGAQDVVVLGRPVHLDAEVAGLNSRDGAAPKRRDSLCTVARAIPGNASLDELAAALNGVVASLTAK